jgi:hypothetical protein
MIAWYVQSSLIFQKPAGIGTLAGKIYLRRTRLPRLHRAGPSTSLDKSLYSIM